MLVRSVRGAPLWLSWRVSVHLSASASHFVCNGVSVDSQGWTTAHLTSKLIHPPQAVRPSGRKCTRKPGTRIAPSRAPVVVSFPRVLPSSLFFSFLLLLLVAFLRFFLW